jgi:hypothetical protein
LLCQFHVVQQWEAELRSYFGKDDKKRTEAYAHLITIQRSKTEDELTQNGLAFKDWCLSNGDQAQKFYSYFLGNWLCEEWVTGWVDIYRPSRWGNYGTNNHTESLFKSTRYKEFLRAVTPVRLLATLTDSIFPQREWEERLREVHNGGKPTTQETLAYRRFQYARQIADPKNFTVKGSQTQPIYFYRSLNPAKEGVVYEIRPALCACTCPSHHFDGKLCKHLIAVQILEQRDGQTTAASEDGQRYLLPGKSDTSSNHI